MALYDQVTYKTLANSRLRIAGAGIAGFLLGGRAASECLSSTWIEEKIDDEIMQAHENRQKEKFMTISGYMTYYTSINASQYGWKGQRY